MGVSMRTLAGAVRMLPLFVAFCLAPPAAAAERDFTFGPHPRLQHSFPEAFTSQIEPGSPEALKRWAGLLKAADAIVAAKPKVPTEGGQWIFYYACPKHNCGLVQKDDKHVCPKCDKVYDDKRTRLAFVTKQHNQLNAKTLTLAKAWHVSRQPEYAQAAYRILSTYARLHPGWSRHDRWGRKGVLAVIGGRRYCQSLSDAVGIIHMAKAYDLLYNFDGVEAAERKLIEEQFFEATVNSIYSMYLFYDGKNNHMTWFNAAAATVGAVLGKADYLDRAINGRKGLRQQFKHSVSKQGIWYEGTISYHYYALQAIIETVLAARQCGLDLKDVPVLKRMFATPLELSYPNGQLPALNDGDRVFLGSYRRWYRFALQTWGDPIFKAFVDGSGQVGQRESRVYEDAGLAYLRRGQGERAVTAILDFGEHGGHHGHPDKLNLMLYTLGQELFLDPGRLTYRCPEHKSWTRQTVAHNTVVVDQRSQRPIPGRLLGFEQHAQYDLVIGESESYPGTVLRRALVLADDLLIDLYHVSGKGNILDWVLHGQAKLVPAVPLEPHETPLHKAAGYQHLTDLRHGAMGTPLQCDWQLTGESLVRSHIFAKGSLYTGNGIGYQLTQKVPFVLIRHRGAPALFVVAHDLSGTGQALTDLDIDLADGVVLRFSRDKQPWRVRWDFHKTLDVRAPQSSAEP